MESSSLYRNLYQRQVG